jgi:serine O-acetyltransferase
MAQHQVKPALDKLDPVWGRIRREAEDSVRREPELATFIYSTVLHHNTLEAAIGYRLAGLIDHPTLSGELIRQAYADALEDVPTIGEAFRADIMATADRDPATRRLIEPMLYYKGYGARDGTISRSTCKAVRRRCFNAIFIRRPRSGGGFSWIMPPDWSSARRQ